MLCGMSVQDNKHGRSGRLSWRDSGVAWALRFLTFSWSRVLAVVRAPSDAQVLLRRCMGEPESLVAASLAPKMATEMVEIACLGKCGCICVHVVDSKTLFGVKTVCFLCRPEGLKVRTKQ